MLFPKLTYYSLDNGLRREKCHAAMTFHLYLKELYSDTTAQKVLRSKTGSWIVLHNMYRKSFQLNHTVLASGVVMDLNGSEGTRFPTSDLPHPVHPLVFVTRRDEPNSLVQSWLNSAHCDAQGLVPGPWVCDIPGCFMEKVRAFISLLAVLWASTEFGELDLVAATFLTLPAHDLGAASFVVFCLICNNIC